MTRNSVGRWGAWRSPRAEEVIRLCAGAALGVLLLLLSRRVTEAQDRTGCAIPEGWQARGQVARPYLAVEGGSPPTAWTDTIAEIGVGRPRVFVVSRDAGRSFVAEVPDPSAPTYRLLTAALTPDGSPGLGDRRHGCGPGEL